MLWSASNGGDLSYVEPSDVEWKAIIDGVVKRLGEESPDELPLRDCAQDASTDLPKPLGLSLRPWRRG